ncbi:cyclin-like protein [Eremomyces bilateralis CBS 781.70]|uniref:RNA polymerase II holoenzyme cyclin-like subunit n=1 Tax=Eremomyces bilateralis CBS 781.70 TaxID=1392243 RepID=A0A6G1G262_9PEZI|nr:cyclin-like protein [Eremomyces bilateralis CBS 781.70]KAF1812011.1 cyclin-like protein [Eremomyces bilateralis CBS 781.70]
MKEDDLYRASTQYRLWSFAPEKLAALRVNTNSIAAERVIGAIQRARAQRLGTASGDASESEPQSQKRESREASTATGDQETECLTADEELKLVEYYSTQCVPLAKPFKFPINVVATAIQFMKRFYLFNSPMTYHPKQIMPSALFLATKTENHHTALKEYSTVLKGAGLKKVSPDEILAPEFVITQGLRFTFDVRHPHRALKGIYMEVFSMIKGDYAPIALDTRTARDIQTQILRLPAQNGAESKSTTQEGEERLNQAYAAAKEILGYNAILTDAYLLYTPSQISFASLLIADEPLTSFLLSSKLPSGSDTINELKAKVLSTIRSCAEMLRAGPSSANVPREELIRIDKKLYQCRNPEKMDLVGLNKAQKRDGAVEGVIDEAVAKKRKLERERTEREGEDLFGPSLAKPS